MPTLISTPGASDANAYADYTVYQAYWQARLYNTTQLAADQTTAVEPALIWATRLMDAIFRWRGIAASSTQALAFPRTGLLTPNGFALPSTTIPPQIEQATCEYAGILIVGGDRTADDPSVKVIGSEIALESLKVGPVALSWGSNTFSTLESFDAFVRSLGPDLAYLSKAMPDSVRLLVPPKWYVQSSLKQKIFFGAF